MWTGTRQPRWPAATPSFRDAPESDALAHAQSEGRRLRGVPACDLWGPAPDPVGCDPDLVSKPTHTVNR